MRVRNSKERQRQTKRGEGGAFPMESGSALPSAREDVNVCMRV